ncbi:D-amino-acid transaminase [Metabacillus herbersteinensis]|uniref:D-alanine aminotransferase n=1 Tax=Metabacillus herbersteinensis TaxID=283816 RepID=A0ABV6GEM1_9BACI
MRVLLQDQLLNRDEVAIDIEDRGYQFGDGVYEVMRVYEGQLFTINEHLERLARSADQIRMKLPLRLDVLKERLIELVSENSVQNGAVYVQVSRGVSLRNHSFPGDKVTPVLIAYPLPGKKPAQEQQNGVQVNLVDDMRWLRCDIKSLNLLWNVMAKQEALDKGTYEALLHRDGTITEGSSTNFYAVKDGTVYTHPANNLILNGITRMKIIELCSENGIPFMEKELYINERTSFDEAFISSTTIEIVPVTKIEEDVIGEGKPGEVTKRLQELFRKITP